MGRKRYSETFKKETVLYAQKSNLNKGDLAKNLGISRSMLYRWIEEYENELSNPISKDERKEFNKLRKENERLKMEYEILKKAIKAFSTHSG